MERIQVLIEKLQQQYQQKENASSMLVTLQLLQNELTALQHGNKVLGTSKVSVVMPNGAPFNRNFQETKPYDARKEEAIVAPIAAETKPEPQPFSRPLETAHQKYYPQESAVAEVQEQPVAIQNVPLFNMHIDVVEAPTLVQQQIHKEVNELIANHKESLNDRLKQEQKEIAHVLKASP